MNSELQGQMLIILFSFWREIIVRMEISIGILQFLTLFSFKLVAIVKF